MGSSGKLSEIDTQYVGVYSEADVGQAPWVDSTDLTSPMWANVPANERLALVIGDASKSDGNIITDSEYDRQVPGDVVDGTVVIEKLGPTGEVVERIERETTEEAGGGWGDPSSLTYAEATLNDGIYRISAKGSDFHYYIKVGNPIPDFDDALNTINGTLTDGAQAIKDELNNGNIQRLTTTTNATGHYSFDVPANTKVVTVTARKAPNIPVDPQNLTQQEIRDYYDIDESSLENLDQQQTSAALDKLQNTTIYVPSAPVTARPPAQNVDITMVEVGYPQYGDLDALQEQLGLLDALFGNESLSNLPPALQDRFEELSRQQKEDLYERYNEIKNQNNKLEQRYNELLNESQSPTIDINETSDAELRDRINKLQQAVTEVQSSIETGEDNLERGQDTVTWTQDFPTALDMENVIVKAHYSNGSSEIVSDEYLSVESMPGNSVGIGSSSVVVEEYPMPSDVAGVRFEVIVANEDGVGRASRSFNNPAYSGEVPKLSSVALSTLSPGPDDTVTVNLNPTDDSTFRSVDSVEAWGPNGQPVTTTLDNSTGEMTFETTGKGTHTVRVTFSDAEGKQHVIPVRVKAAAADRDRPTGIRAVDTPFGTVAHVGDGLEDGAVEVDSSGEIRFVAQLAQDGDIPNEIHAYDTGMSLSADTTRTISVVRGDDREQVGKHVRVVYHTAGLSEDALVYRNDEQPITRDAKTRYGKVYSAATGSTIESWTDADGSVTLQVNNDPSRVDRALHWVRVRTSDIDVPFVGQIVPVGLTPATSGAQMNAPTAA